MAAGTGNIEDVISNAGGRISVAQSSQNHNEKNATHPVLGAGLVSRATLYNNSSSNGTSSDGGRLNVDSAYLGLQRIPENTDASKGAVPVSSAHLPSYNLNFKLIGLPRRVLVGKTGSSVSDDSDEMEKNQNSADAAEISRSKQENQLPTHSQALSHTELVKINQAAGIPGPPKTMVSGSMKYNNGLPSLEEQGAQSLPAAGYSVPNPCSQLPRAMPKLYEVSEPLESQPINVCIPPNSELGRSLPCMPKIGNSYQKVKDPAKSANGERSLTKEVEGQAVSYESFSLEEKTVEIESSQPINALESTFSHAMAVKDKSYSSSQLAELTIGSSAPGSTVKGYPSQTIVVTSGLSTTGGSMISSEKQVGLHDGQAYVNIIEGSRSTHSTLQHQASKTDNDDLNIINLEQPKKVASLPAPSSISDKVVKKGRESASRKFGESDHFVWVNKRRYQKLGKIGSGGSSDVYKVISQDCTIFALKRIKLKGREYKTASGFYQEIEYLQQLRGQRHIIDLIDFEVSDKKIFEDVNAQHGEFIVEDVYIYMVLEYGEIDFANMLDHKKKEMAERTRLDENWIRLYLEHILEAVNAIHEKRIVHADLKPGNFLLVHGVLKLIDFGIAKVIKKDTTNIVRECQVGTLNYMSPEACLMTDDERGSVVKCGRASDVWSVGCILYQIVYGRTPFSHLGLYAKIKEITDPAHQIQYPPVSNPALLDFMKKCLVWDKNKRLRIPQLLEHPLLQPVSICYSFPCSTSHSPESVQKLMQSCCNYVSIAGVSKFKNLMDNVVKDGVQQEEDFHRINLVKLLNHWVSKYGPSGLLEVAETVIRSAEKQQTLHVEEKSP